MTEHRTGLQKSVSAIFAGATIPEEARPVSTHPAGPPEPEARPVYTHPAEPPTQHEEAPHEPPARKRSKRKRVRPTLRLAKVGV